MHRTHALARLTPVHRFGNNLWNSWPSFIVSLKDQNLDLERERERERLGTSSVTKSYLETLRAHLLCIIPIFVRFVVTGNWTKRIYLGYYSYYYYYYYYY